MVVVHTYVDIILMHVHVADNEVVLTVLGQINVIQVCLIV